MATTIYGNTAATTPKDQFISSLEANKNIPAGQAGSPWSLPTDRNPVYPTALANPTSPAANPVSSARSSYLSTFNTPDALNTARQAYLDSLNPSQATTDARQKYLDFTTAADSGIAALEGQGRGIPLQLVRGEQEKLGKQSEITAKRLQGDVTLAEQADQARANAAKAGVDFANTDYTTNQNAAKTALDFATTDQTQATQDTANALKTNTSNNITNPYYYVGNKIVNASTGRPEYENNNGEIVRLADNKRYSNTPEFLRDAGINSFNQIQKEVGTNNPAATKFETVTLGSGKNAQKVRYGYDAKGNIVQAIDLATGKSILGSSGVKPVGSTTSTSTSKGKVTLAQGTNFADQYLSTRKGTDGHVSPEDYAKAKQAWIDDGLDVNQFKSRFKQYVNPIYKDQY